MPLETLKSTVNLAVDQYSVFDFNCCRYIAYKNFTESVNRCNHRFEKYF